MTSSDTALTKLYSRVAGVYDAWTHFTESRSLRAALDETGIGKEEAVLEVADETFDVVMNNSMLGVVPDSLIEPILPEMHRVLRPGGRLVIVTMQRPQRRAQLPHRSW